MYPPPLPPPPPLARLHTVQWLTRPAMVSCHDSRRSTPSSTPALSPPPVGRTRNARRRYSSSMRPRRRPSSGRNKAEYRHVGSGRLDTCGSRRSSEARAWTTTLPSTWAGGQARSSTHGLRLRPRWHRAPGRQASGTSLRASRLLWRLHWRCGRRTASPRCVVCSGANPTSGTCKLVDNVHHERPHLK